MIGRIKDGTTESTRIDPSYGSYNAIPASAFEGLDGGHPDTGPALAINNVSGARPTLDDRDQNFVGPIQPDFVGPIQPQVIVESNNSNLIYIALAIVGAFLVFKIRSK